MGDEPTAKPGESAAKPIDLTAEEKYWQEHHHTQPHATEGTTYEHFRAGIPGGCRGCDQISGQGVP